MIEQNIQVLIVASSPIVRAGLLSLLSVEAARLGFDAWESDSFPEPDEFEVALLADGTDEVLFEELLRSLSDSVFGVVVLCDENLAEQRAAMLVEVGVRGWAILPQEATPEEMAASILASYQGLVTVTASLAEKLLPPELNPAPTSGSPLTHRETEVLGLVSRGLPNKSIARSLGISGHTVKFHISSIYTKLGAANRAEAVSVAARLKLITL